MREENEMKKALISGVFSLMLAAAFTVPAFAEELIVGGQAVGIQISTEGVLVAGLSQVETVDGTASPAEDAGLKQGDVIIKIDGKDFTIKRQNCSWLNAGNGGLGIQLKVWLKTRNKRN